MSVNKRNKPTAAIRIRKAHGMNEAYWALSGEIVTSKYFVSELMDSLTELGVDINSVGWDY
jgi:hypothetical protein